MTNRYRSYKPSGRDFLGDVPDHWELLRLGRMGSFFKGGGGTKQDEIEGGVPCVRYGDLYTHHQFSIKHTRSGIAETSTHNYQPLRYGDVLFAGSGETAEEIGKSAVNLIEGRSFCGGDVIVLRPSVEVDARFLGYATDCHSAVHQKACMGRGVTIMHIYGGELKNLLVPLPPVPEQRAIADYLDTETARIDTLISKKRRLIELLAEYRTALITQTVTSGLDPSPSLCPSGVDWLGDIPTHWEARRLKDVGKLVGGAGFPETLQGVEGEELPFFKVGDLSKAKDGLWLVNSEHTISRETATSLRAQVVPKDAIAYAKIGAALLLNRRRIVAQPSCIDNNMSAYIPDASRIATKWALYTLCLIDFGLHVNPGAVPSLSEGDQAFIPIAIPPIAEQRAIADYLDTETACIEALSSRVKAVIKLLEEYRKALITAAVTGDLAIPGLATETPTVRPISP